MSGSTRTSRILKQTLIFILGLALFCGLMGFAAYLSLGFVLGKSKEMTVPDLRGRDIVEVLEQMETENLGIRVAGFDYSDTLAQNHVVRQDPPPGHVLKTGREIRLFLSRGPQKIQVPELRGLRREEALSHLEARVFKAGHSSLLFHDSIPEGHVIASDPDAASWFPAGSSVNLLLSAGKRPLILRMPDLQGMHAEDMLSTLDRLNLRISELRSASNPDFPPNRVLDQTPPPGSPVLAHSGVGVIMNQPQTPRDALDLIQGMRLVRYRLPHTLIRSHIRGSLTAWGLTFDFVDDVFEGNQEVFLLIPGSSEAHVRIEENGFPVFEARLHPFTGKPDILYAGGRYGFSLMALDPSNLPEPRNAPDRP